MKTVCAAVAALVLFASPALADKKIDDARDKALEQLSKGKPEEAVKTMEKTARQNPTSPEAHLWLGRIQQRTGALDEAAASLSRAAELSGAAPPAVKAEVLASVADLDLLRGSGKDALEHAGKAVEAQATPDALATLAEAQVRTQKPAEALATADRAVAAAATSAAAHEARGEALLALHRADDAVAAFRKAVELDAKRTSARVGLASALLAQGKAAEAVAEARKATELDAQSGEAFAVLGTALLAENPKSWNDAIAQAQQGAFLNGRSPAVQYAVGKIFEAANNFDQAIAAYRKAVEVDPGFAPAQLAMVRLQVRRGEVDAAYPQVLELVRNAPSNPEVLLLHGQVLLRKGEYDDAADALENSVKIAPNVAEAQALFGTACQYTGRSEEAYEAYKKAVALDPKNLEYKVTYGLLHGMVGQHEQGVALLKQVLATPGYKEAAAHINVGWLYRNMKPARTEESVAAYRKALEIDPKNSQIFLGMGWAYSYGRSWDESIGSFKKAIEMDAKLAGEANNGIAWCYFFKKDMAKAREFLGKAQATGRKDSRLAAQIERIEKLLAAGAKEADEEVAKTEGPKDEGPDIAALDRDMKSRSPAVRRRAAIQFRKTGAAGVDFLSYALQTDPDVGVREAVVDSLCALGPAARPALPALRQARDAQRIVDPNAPMAQMQLELREEDLKRKVKDCLPKIEGR